MAIALLLVGVVAVAKLVPLAMNTNFYNRNDSTALIAAQRELEAMAAQNLDTISLGACSGPPASSYYFCDTETQLIALGGQSSVATVSETIESGCALTAHPTVTGDFVIDWTATCPSGYSATKNWTWDPINNIQQRVELRWRTVTTFRKGVPLRRVYIIAARAGQPGQSFQIANLQTVVSRR